MVRVNCHEHKVQLCHGYKVMHGHEGPWTRKTIGPKGHMECFGHGLSMKEKMV